ncbi:MAG: 3'-5' exonuclease, partial [Methanogenium sp.]
MGTNSTITIKIEQLQQLIDKFDEMAKSTGKPATDISAVKSLVENLSKSSEEQIIRTERRGKARKESPTSIKGIEPTTLLGKSIKDFEKDLTAASLSLEDFSKKVAVFDLETGPIKGGKVDFITQIGIIETTLGDIVKNNVAALEEAKRTIINIKPPFASEAAYEEVYAKAARKQNKPSIPHIKYEELIGPESKDVEVALKEAAKLISDKSLVIGHNIAGFDIKVLDEAFKKAGTNLDELNVQLEGYIDTLKESRQLYPKRAGHKLEDWGAQFEREEKASYKETAHSAIGDAERTLTLLNEFVNEYSKSRGDAVNSVLTKLDKMIDKLDALLSRKEEIPEVHTADIPDSIDSISVKPDPNINKLVNRLLTNPNSSIGELKSGLQTYFNPNVIAPTKESTQLDTATLWGPGIKATDKMNAVVDNLSKSLSKLQDNIVKAVESGLAGGGWQILESKSGEKKFELAEGGREWGLNLIDTNAITKALVAMTNDKDIVGPNTSTSEIVNLYKSQRQSEDLRVGGQSSEDMSKSVVAWLTKVDPRMLNEYTQPIKILSKMIKDMPDEKSKIDILQKRSPDELEGYYKETVLGDLIEEDIRKKFVKTIGIPAARVSSQGTVGFESKYGGERALSGFATITTGFERLAKEFKNLSGSDDIFMDMMHKIEQLPFRPEKGDVQSEKLAQSFWVDYIKPVSEFNKSGENIQREAYTGAIQYRRVERGELPGKVLQELSTLSLSDLENQFKSLNISYKELTDSLSRIDYSNFYDLLDAIYQSSGESSIQKAMKKMLGKEADSSIRELAKVKDELIGFMPTVSPGRPKRKPYDEESIKVLTRTITNAEGKAYLKPEDQKKHIIDTASTWQEEVRRANKLGKSSLYANLSPEMSKAMGIPEARPIDLSDASSAQLDEFNSNSTSKLKELNKTMTSANTSGLRGLAPFEKFGSIQRQLSYSANAISGGIIGGGEMALPSLRSKSEQGMIESGQYGTKGYGFNVLTELRSTASTFEDQILISGRLAEAFTKIVKPLIGPATNQEKGISEIQSGFKRRSSKGEKATAEDIGISKEDFEDAIKNVSKEYQNILGVPKKIPGRQDIAYLSKEVESLTRTHRGESIEVQSAKLTELFMNYFGRKFSTRFGTKGVSMTPKYGELPKGISSLEDVGKYIKSGFTGKIDLGSEGIGWSKVPKSMGELLSDMLEFKGDTELKDRLLESGNKFIVDLFKDVKQGFVGKDEAEKQKDLFADVTKKLAEHGDIFGEDLKDGLEGIAQITDRYKKMYSEKLLYTMQPIEARISARGVAKRGLMPEVLEGMVSNLVGTRRDVEGGKTRLNPASPTILEEGSYTTNRNINKKMNDYLEALSYSALSAEESGKVKERLEAEGAKPEQIESAIDFEKKWKVYSNVIDEFGEQIQSFVAPKFMQIIEEPHIYKSWSGEEIDRGIKGERLNYQAYAAYAGVFGKDSEMMKELSIASDIAASEGWELITALQALDPKLKDFTKSLTSGLKSVDVKDIESFIQGTASMSELKGTLLDIQKFPTAFNLKMPSTKTIGESEEFYIPGPSARQTYSETLMGGQVAPTKVSRDLTNLVEAAKKLQSNIALYMNPDISSEDKVGYEKTTALVKSELRSMLFDKGGKVDIFKAQERKNTIDTQEADDFIKQLKQGVSKTEKISTAFAPTGSKSGMTELETIEAWETSLKKENRKDYYAVLFGKISDILMGPKKEPIIEETTKLEKQLKRVQSGDTTVGKSASQLEAYIRRNNQKLEYTSSFDRAAASSRSKFKDFAEGLGLDPSVSLKKEIEEQMESLSKAKANYANTLAESVLGPKQSIENTFFQRTVPGSVTAKAVTGIADKTDDFNRALGQLEDLGGTSFDSIINNLSEINKQHKDLIDKSRQLGIPVLREGEIGLHPDLAEKMSTTDKGVKTNVKERLEQRKDTYISSVRYPFTGTLSVQAHASKLMTEDELGKNAALTKHAVVVPGAPQLDIAKLKTEVLTPLQDILNQKIQQRSDVWESGGPGAADAAGQLTNEINNLLKIIRDITPKYTNMEQKLDFDGDALFLHTGQVEKSRKEIQSQFEAMGKDLTSARSLFNTLFTAVKETDVKSLSEMAYQFSKKHPEEKGFKFLERSYSEKQVAGIKNIKDVLIALRADEVPKEKGESKTAYKERMQPFIEAYLKEKIFPVIESKTTGMYAPEEMEAFQQKAISGMGKIDATSEFEKVASKILNETARTQLEDKKYKDAITGQLYKLHTGQTVEGISRIARISERETGFGTGLAGTAGKIAKPSEEFLQKWPKESIALGEKPVEEFAARMNEVMRFVIQKGLDEKHAGVKSAGLDLIANVTKSSGAKKIIESMSSDASKFEELSQFNDQITREVQLRLGEHPTESLREELKRFSPEGVSESQISNMGRKDLEKAIIGQVNLEAVFKELFKMIKRQAIEGLTQQTLESYKTNPRRKSQHMAAFGGSAEESAQKYAKQEIEKEAKADGIKARKHIVSTMEPLYQLRTSTETPRSVGARASKKLKTEDITDLTFSNKENIQKYGGKYVNALNTSNVLSGSMESTFKNSGISAYSDMVESAAKKRMQELNQLEEEISKYHSITKELPMGVMGGGANTEAVPGLFADIWKDMEKKVFGDKGIPSKEDPKYAEKTMSGFSKVMELVRDRMGELSDKLAMPMISDEESFGAYTSFIEKHPTSLSNMNIEAKSAADALQVSLPDSENKTATIEATTEEYLKFMDDLLRFQTGMSDQALRITASMEAVDFQKSMLERAFPGVSKSIQSAIPDNITRALSEQEQSKTAEQTRITKEIFAKEIDKPTFTSKDKTVADVIRETSNIGKDVSGLAWPATGGFVPGSGAAAAAGGSGGGGGGDDDDELRKLMERLKAAIDEIERTSGKGTTTDKQLYDLMSVYKYIEKELRSINADIPDFTDPKHPAKAATSVEGGTLMRRFKETVDKYGAVSSGFSGFESLEKSYDIYKAALEGGFNTQAGSSRGATDFSYLQDLDIEKEHPDTMQGIHKNLKALFAVAKRRQSSLSSATMEKFPQEVQDLLSQITEEGPNVEISGQLMDAVKKLPKEQRGF